MESLALPRATRASGTLRLPGSKSISNRTLLLAALSRGATVLEGLLDSDDTRVMQAALAALGVRIDAMGDARARVHGIGAGRGFPVKAAEIFLGNSGTSARSLAAVLALADGHYTLAGVPRMHERPIGDLVDALRPAGARIRYLGNEGFPPLSIEPCTPTAPGTLRIRGNVSSQFLSGVLMALPWTGQAWRIEIEGELISKPYVELTLGLMARFGVQVERDGWRAFALPGGAGYSSPGEIAVEGDASSASYFLAAGLLGGGPVRVVGMGRASVQGDVHFTRVLAAMGATIAFGEDWAEASGQPPLAPFDLDMNLIPDAAMTSAVLALFATGPCTLRNIGSWRVKETDRIAAMATELRKFGAVVDEGPDWIRVSPPPGFLTPDASRLMPVSVATYDDHRMAMCFSLATFGPAPVVIEHPGCVAKTFPRYFDEFAKVTGSKPGTDPLNDKPGSVPIITIDGPSASGKGTVAARVARELGFHYLDSGALYRLVALIALQRGLALDDPQALARAAEAMQVSFGEGTVALDGQDVTAAMREEDVGVAASRVAAHPRVRDVLLARQRAFREAPGLVADGRDMGSVVFPDASLKVFLTADVRIRAERRYKQLMEKGMYGKMEDVVEDLRRRDERDATRPVAPLRHYPDAVFLETTGLTVEEAVGRVLSAWREKQSQ